MHLLKNYTDSLKEQKNQKPNSHTQFYFRTTQKCKRYLKVAFKYLVLFRRRNVSLVPFGAILTLPLLHGILRRQFRRRRARRWPHQASIATHRVWMKQRAKDPAQNRRIQAKIFSSPNHDTSLQHLTSMTATAQPRSLLEGQRVEHCS